jgi:hypothetical protein
MLDMLLSFLLEWIVGSFLFGCGRFVLRCLSFGYIRLDAPTPLQTFLTILIGFASLLLAVFVLLRASM